MSATQLALNFKLRDDATFASFTVGENQLSYDYLQQFIIQPEEWFIYLYGTKATGKTHLLEACCAELAKQNKSALIVSLTDHQDLDPSMLLGLENLDYIFLDDIQTIYNKPRWEEAIFHLYNRLTQNQKHLVITADVSPTHLKSDLPDLKSRLSQGVSLHIHPLSDENKIKALQNRARQRGLELNTEVAEYLLNHLPRNMTDLLEALEKLDQASLTNKRKLTIPFVKSVI